MDNEWKDQFDYYYKKVNNANVESAQKQMDFQREMSNTSHVREVKDLIAAGLNPVLSANNGASTPAGAYANVDSSPISAKFASQNLNKELENARLITRMQNDNSYAIAMQQLATQMQMNKYTTDENNRTSRFNTIVNEYGALAGLVYGMTEGMYDNLGVNVNGAIESMADNNNTLKSLIDSVGNTSQKSQDIQTRTDELLAKGKELMKEVDYILGNTNINGEPLKRSYTGAKSTGGGRMRERNTRAIKKFFNSIAKSLKIYYNK